ncbi:MAG: zinc ribbon domain-containing protein [Acidobacteriota bacterium]
MTGKAAAPPDRAAGGLHPWHLLLVGAMASVTAGAVIVAGSGPANTILVAVAILSAVLVALGVFRTLAPFARTDAGEQVEMVAGRTRSALEREKMLVLRSIKEAEFDRAMKKISDADFQEMSARLRQRAAGLLRQLDGDAGYRALIERDLAALLGREPGQGARPPAAPGPIVPHATVCAGCRTANDSDARYCKACGAALTGGVA